MSASDNTLDDTPGQSSEDLLRAAAAAIEREEGGPWSFSAFGGELESTRLCVGSMMVPAESLNAFMDEWVRLSIELAAKHGTHLLERPRPLAS